MNYKDTLLMPTTLFEMKANLNTKEPTIQQEWLATNLVNQILTKNKKHHQFILHDGPPYANGNLHVGHSLNKILKDFIVRYYTNKGYYAPWICGWDTHGLPIESAVVNSGVDRKATPPGEFREICQQYALNQINNQISQFSRLGLLTDFNDKYVTLDLDYEISQLELFKTMVEKNLVYRYLKPVYWSPTSESALAEAEIEYEDVTTPSIYVTFKVIKGNKHLAPNSKIIIWTTTPWTIPMNQLLAVGEKISYSVVKIDEQEYVVASDLLATVSATMGWTDFHVVKEISGKDLVGIETEHAWNSGLISKVVAGHHVTTDSGTGIVHIASGFGEDDYLIAKANGVEIYAPLDDQGKYTMEINDPSLVGVFYEDANKIIGQKLEQTGHLLKLKFIKHRQGIDWRTKKPIIYRATAQWFVSIEKLKPQLLKEIKKVNWNPEWAQKRMLDMIANRDDWCISRQRLWGVPIIAFYDENNNPQFSLELIDHVLKLFKQEQTTNIWFTWSADQLLPTAYQHKGWRKEQDIMDVWFDSGVSNLAVIKNRHLNYPVDVYLEGNDQFRGWFNSSLITAVIDNNHAPYKTVLSHGFVNDEKGRKMSKSLGNTISPLDIVDEYGSDILRMWVASVDYTDDVKIGPEIIKQCAESYRKIRNTLRFILTNLSDFNVDKDSTDQLAEVDLYTLHLTQQFKKKVDNAYEDYNFNNVYILINNFVINTLSKFYLDFIKDILYIEKAKAPRRCAVQTTLYHIYRTLIDVLKPLLPHTVEEAHRFINYDRKAPSVHLEAEHEVPVVVNDNLIVKWDKVLRLRDDVNKELEVQREAKAIKKSLACQLTIYLQPDYQELQDIEDLHQIFIVSEIIFTNNKEGLTSYPTSYLKVQEKVGHKCARCWMIVDKLSENNEICQRCFDVLYK
ncbi:isoleucine--tRNA ligase [Spiroplasma eriocheiris]|uniref:Isoleucine--tRNA ligase n=1 Tax=Spiroplasma eriocheiris TaxID=315358 RepID=A0A0H3XHS0_9MOLU|nr:isoleucine--tRNA ligase [Spiroplasma eriocheiris]AHF57870.1 putative isoleucyl-tRNA synthetase [Spiroplasma eriocheiris CCTCC M 207170]AKM54313.1 isoleucyl-tRNA synthetase [Spiroplasma eriocheiris]